MKRLYFSIWILSLAIHPMVGFSTAVVHAQVRDTTEVARNAMVDEEIVAAGVTNSRVIESMRSTPRHEFVRSGQRQWAYLDMALPIGNSQTISPPFVVAYMTEALDPQPKDKVLEIGTGSGYQAAVLSPLVADVYTIEIVESLGRRADRTLRKLHYKNIHTRIGDGFQGWSEHAPFDKIIVTCSPEDVPAPLVDQHSEGGRMVIPVGERYQQTLYMYRKVNCELKAETLRPTLFVPMTGAAEQKREILPDPAHPKIVNGSFENITEGKDKSPVGWHYQRQFTLVQSPRAPEGSHFATFKNEQPGRGSQALQGLAIDGRKVGAIHVSLYVKTNNLLSGQNRNQVPRMAISFYDKSRATVGRVWLGPWLGTADWKQERRTFQVPRAAREAIVHIGLLGATGELSVDDIQLEAVPKP